MKNPKNSEKSSGAIVVDLLYNGIWMTRTLSVWAKGRVAGGGCVSASEPGPWPPAVSYTSRASFNSSMMLFWLPSGKNLEIVMNRTCHNAIVRDNYEQVICAQVQVKEVSNVQSSSGSCGTSG